MPVDLFAFSTKGVGIILRVHVALQQEAHGGGLAPAHRHDPGRQSAGLRFDSIDQPY
jgi:hypothetical protein